MIKWMISWKEAVKHPLRASFTSGVGAGVGVGSVAYFRVASHNVGAAVGVGALAACVVLVAVYRRVGGRDHTTVIHATGTAAGRSVGGSRHFVFSFLLIASAVALVSLALITHDWSLLAPAVLFVALATALAALRRLDRDRRRF